MDRIGDRVPHGGGVRDRVALAPRDVRGRLARRSLARPPGEGGDLPDELFRAGFQFADGSKVTSLAGVLPAPAAVVDTALDQEPEGPLLVPRGGGGGGQSWSHRLWLWPLPDERPLSFVCEWPALGIALTRAEIDLDPIREAAGRSLQLWDDDRRTVT